MSARRRPAAAVARSLRGAVDIRLRAALVVIVMVLSFFGARLVQLQGLDPQAYAARAAASGLVHVALPAARGRIVDRSGEVLADSIAGEMIVADPQATKRHAAAISKILADRLGLDYFSTLAVLSQGGGSRFAYVARRIPSTKATAAVAAVEKAGYHGLATRADPLRVYPGDDVAANLVGFMNDSGQPSAGLEQSFDGLLKGRSGHETYEVGDGNRIPLGENSEVKPVNGKTLRLTIDADAQWYAQRLLRTAVTSSHAASGTVVAVDSDNGQVLALADYPTVNANNGGQSPKSDWGSRAVSEVYEPGSVEKVLTTSALIDQHLASPRTKLVVPPVLQVPGGLIHDDVTHGTERLTLAGAVALSSNIGVALAATRIKSTVLGSYLTKFGLGQTTDIGMPGESGGILSNPQGWSALTHANVAFGQGVAVTALQMAMAVNSVANGGRYVAPSLVLGKATDDSGQVVGSATSATHRVMATSTAHRVAKMLELVTTPGKGTAGYTAPIDGYNIAGKTGTAQEPGGACHCYRDGFYDVSFAGFAPAENPRFTVYVVVRHPQGEASGAGTAGPVFRQLMTYLLQKYDVPPTGKKPTNLHVYW